MAVWLAAGGGALAQDTSTGHAQAVEGDRLQVNGRVVRLHGLIAPALKDPGGAEARDLLERVVAGWVVTCHRIGVQRNGLMVAGCEARGRDIGALAVEAGAARDCPAESRGRYREQEARAPVDGPGRRAPLPPECVVRSR
ncbi:MAG: hypothetical protein EAZ99_03720 [Alphaproteobacteria bacterium]|nr:hypothetical protein [Alphaproteobacteria bacterium]TAD91211.1 MAG: hypothetical protein EAZ99_03720 [Alphaproteobacteria bacterium]